MHKLQSYKRILAIKNSKPGFTFIEVIMSILIIGIVAMYLGTAIPTSLLIVQETQDISKATDLAQKYIEQVKYNLLDTVNYDDTGAGTEPPLEITDDVTANDKYSVTTTVADLETETIGGNTVVTLKRLDIVFTKSGSESILVQLSTEIARPRG
jgi:prepilin-type N-terminal cleavage/methylation domain-containing protein